MLSAFSKAVTALTSDIPSNFPAILKPVTYCQADRSSTTKTSSNLFYNARPLPGSCFTLFDAKGVNGEPVSVFGFPKNSQAGCLFDWLSHCNDKTGRASHTLKSFKMLKHHSLLKYLDGCEVASGIFIATEHVTALRPCLLECLSTQDFVKARQLLAVDFAWSIFSILQGIEFINTAAKKVWGSLSANTVYVTDSGEWKLGLPQLIESEDINLRTFIGAIQSNSYGNDILQSIQNSSKQISIHEVKAVDRMTLGGLMVWCHKAQMVLHSKETQEKINLHISSLDEWSTTDYANVPMMPSELKMCISSLMTVDHWTGLEKSIPYFNDNAIVKIQLFIRSIALQDDDSINQFFSQLPSLMQQLPTAVRTRQILSILTENMTLLVKVPAQLRMRVIFCAADGLSDSDVYRKLVLKPLLIFFKLPDRLTRYSLLHEFANLICDDIAKGCSDNISEIKDVTIRTMVHLIPLVNSNRQQGLLQVLVKCATTDIETHIRQNALMCLCRTFACVPYQRRVKIVLPALTQGLHDSSPEVRQYVLKATICLVDDIHPRDLLGKVVTSLLQFVVSSERLPIEQRSAMLSDEVYPLIEECIQRSRVFFIDGKEITIATDNNSGDSSSLYNWMTVGGASWVTSLLSSSVNEPTSAPSKPQTSASIENTNMSKLGNTVDLVSSCTSPVASGSHLHANFTQEKPHLARQQSKNVSGKRLTSDPFSQISEPAIEIDDPQTDPFCDLLDDLEESNAAYEVQTHDPIDPILPIRNNLIPKTSLKKTNISAIPSTSIIPKQFMSAGTGAEPKKNFVPLGMTTTKVEAKVSTTSGNDFWAEFSSDDASTGS
eukprot:GHVH01000379.1.p1 GENE.GHVH01000379.1~~GHVH01000379.1.p1  ORF type:complete len:831 (+),score=87.59 GHVH01000379.1:74-2566(+)